MHPCPGYVSTNLGSNVNWLKTKVRNLRLRTTKGLPLWSLNMTWVTDLPWGHRPTLRSLPRLQSCLEQIFTVLVAEIALLPLAATKEHSSCDRYHTLLSVHVTQELSYDPQHSLFQKMVDIAQRST